MLLNLHVKNLAIIDEVDIDFTGGFNVLTGETGAGKSIILGSINLALGAKFSKDIIREGASFALVELVFSYSDNYVSEYLKDNDIECEDGQVIITRKMTSSRSVSKINGQTVTLSMIQELAGYLIDIHGQHDNKMLINPNEHINILDAYIGQKATDCLEKIGALVKEYNKYRHELESIDIDAEKRLREISLLEYEINEIDSARLKLGEDEKLEEEYKLMSNANNIASALSDARNELESGCADSVSRAARTLIRVSDFSEELRSISDAVADIESMIGECIRDMDGYMSENDFSQEDFEQVEKRLDMINGFKAKYGNSIEKILEYRDNKSTRLESLINSDERVNQLKDKLSELETQINLVCDSLTRIRKEGSVSLCEGITKALNELNFNDASFKVEFEQKDRFTLCGRDNAIFVIRSNVGEGFKPLSKIASGGELSRVMLAIKTVIADTQNMESFIFDEIDAGISGRTAQQVALALDRLSKNRQIICITHLSQLAAMADVNYIIEKKVEGERTFTGIRQLDEEEVTDELARIIGGTKITDSVIESAREMRQLARKCKKDNT